MQAHLSREHRWFKKHKNDAAVNQCYPYERAAKFQRDIRRLGVTDSGRSFLDQVPLATRQRWGTAPGLN